MMKKAAHLLLACSLIVPATAGYATTVTGATVYENTPDPNIAADTTNFASTLAHATFSIGATGINFETGNGYGTSVAAFLNNPTFTNAANGFDPTLSTDPGTELVITGMLTLLAGNNTFSVGHDDGVVLTVAGFGAVVNAPGPTSFNTSPFTVDNTGAAGNFAFTLDYSECCGGPADLEFNVNNVVVAPAPVPEPSSLALLGTGLIGLCGAIRRRVTRRA